MIDVLAIIGVILTIWMVGLYIEGKLGCTFGFHDDYQEGFRSTMWTEEGKRGVFGGREHIYRCRKCGEYK